MPSSFPVRNPAPSSQQPYSRSFSVVNQRAPYTLTSPQVSYATTSQPVSYSYAPVSQPVSYAPVSQPVSYATTSQPISYSYAPVSEPASHAPTSQPVSHTPMSQPGPYRVVNQRSPYRVVNQRPHHTAADIETAFSSLSLRAEPTPSRVASDYASGARLQMPAHPQTNIPATRVDDTREFHSRGPGMRRPSFDGPWSMSGYHKQETREMLDSIANCGAHTRLVQPTLQADHAVLMASPGGKCRGMVAVYAESFAKSRSPKQASLVFGDILKNDARAIVDRHVLSKRLIDEQFDAIMAHTRRLGSNWSDSDHAASEAKKAELSKRVEDVQAGGLRLRAEHKGRLVQDSPRASARELFKHMDKDGFYRIQLSGRGAHVLCARVSHGEDDFRLMDPNTGEFTTTRHSELSAMIAENFGQMRYGDDYGEFRLSRHEL
ncbi:MAG: hypothetical protein ABW123_05925 [Cystobacter sp.]